MKPTGRSLSCYALAREANLAATLHKIITDSSSQSANRFAEQKEDIYIIHAYGNGDLGLWNGDLGLWNGDLGLWNGDLGLWNGDLGLWNVCLRRRVVSCVLNSDTVGRFRRPAGSEFQTDGRGNPVKINALSTRFQITFRNFLKILA